jgi:hypothetical protein
MTEWYCNKDKVKMRSTEIAMKYMQMVQYVPGIKCPQCGVAYLTEDVVMTVVKAAQDALEEK